MENKENRLFSDTVKLEVIKNNLKKNNGSICCEICKKRLSSIDECHFDHIYPYAKGGKSTFDNCQILCSDCNLSKNDKELQEFLLEEKAKQFLAGKISEEEKPKEEAEVMESPVKPGKLTKEEFDVIIKRYIEKKGNIYKVDFSRPYNKLPSVWYVREFYGDLNTLKKAFGIVDNSLNWTRENVLKALRDFAEKNGDVMQKDLKKENGLPSTTCIQKYFPEYKTLTEFKREVLGLKTIHGVWTKEEVLEAGKAFIKDHDKITQKDMKAENGLPPYNVILSLFGSMNEFQREIGAPLTECNELVTKEKVREALKEYFGGNEWVINSRSAFLESFRYKEGVICKRYGSFDKFCEEEDIKLLYYKKRSYSKKEIDDAIHNWIFSGHSIPLVKELSKNGLPSANAIMKYYESWKEPFLLYKKIYDEANRNKRG